MAPDDGAVDVSFVNEFLFSYRAFCSAREVLSLLVARWLYLPTGLSSERDLSPAERAQWRPVVQLRVINVLKRWIELHPCDFGCEKDVRELREQEAAEAKAAAEAAAKRLEGVDANVENNGDVVVRGRGRNDGANDAHVSGLVVARELFRFITGTLVNLFIFLSNVLFVLLFWSKDNKLTDAMQISIPIISTISISINFVNQLHRYQSILLINHINLN